MGPSFAVASATAVTALSSWISDPWPLVPRAVSRIQKMAFSAVCIRYARRPARHSQRVAADLAHGLGGSVEQFGLLSTNQWSRTDRRSPRRRRTRRPDRVTAASALRMSATAIIMASMSFMSTAPRPHNIPVLDRTGERVHTPVRRLGGDHVEVPMQHQGPARGVRALSRVNTLARPGAPASKYSVS